MGEPKILKNTWMNCSGYVEVTKIKDELGNGVYNVDDTYVYRDEKVNNNCRTLQSRECGNRNYLYTTNINTWTLNIISGKTYRTIYMSSKISSTNANNDRRINPVIYLSSKVVTSGENGSLNKPYIKK